MNYKQVFRNHIINQTVKEIDELIVKITWTYPEYKEVDEVLKLKYANEYIKKCIANANVYITNIAAFDNINANLNNVKTHLSNFIQNNTNGLANAIASMDGGLAYTNNIIQKANASKNVIELDSSEILQKLQKSMEASIVSYEKRLEEFEKKSNEISLTMDSAVKNLDATKQRVDSYLANLQTSFNSSESDRGEQFENNLAKYGEMCKNEITTQHDLFLEKRKDIDDETKTILVEMNQRKEQAAKLLQIITTTGFAGNYSKNADYERDTANTMRWISIATFTLISGLAIWILFSFQSNGANWENSLIKILATSLLTGLATYTTRESGKHRKLERKYRKMELELSSLDAFIETLPQEERNTLKVEITKRLFSEDSIDEKETDKKDDENVITGSLLQNLLRMIEDTLKNLSKKGT